MEPSKSSEVSLPLSKKPPTPKEFFPFLLRVLGKAVNFKTGVYVDGASITINVIKMMGYNPDTLEAHGDPTDGWRYEEGVNSGSYGFRFRVRYAFKGGWYKCAHPLTARGKRGQWGLTEAGVEEARRLCALPTRNMTALFLENRIKKTGGLNGTLYNLLRSSVTAKLPLSAASGIVEDHVQNCLTRLISRDSLRTRILAGKNIPDSLLATYAVRAGFTDIRDMGTNPVTREMFGARTERERAKGITISETITDPRVIWGKDSDSRSEIIDVAADPSSFGSIQNLIEWEDFQKCMADIEEVIRERKPRAGDRYMEVLRMKFSGFTVPEIAAEEGVTPFRAASIIAEARRCLKKARKEQALLFT